MGDEENSLPPSKKRAAGRELSRDNPGLDDEEDAPEQETGTFKRASDDVLAGRRIVKVRRSQTTSAPSSNPFAGIQLIPPPTTLSVAATESKAETQPAAEKPAPEDENKTVNAEEVTEKSKEEQEKQTESKDNEVEAESAVDKEDDVEKKSDAIVSEAARPEDAVEKVNSVGEAFKPEVDGEKANEDDKSETVDSSAASAPVNSFQQLSSNQNAFTGLAGTGFSSSTFSFGGSTGSLFGLSTNGNSSLFGTSTPAIVSKTEGSSNPPMQEVKVETGEENEKPVFTADSVLFEYIDGGWKERGKGELKVNVSTSGTETARLLMRSKGNYRLILNASLFPDMKLANMEKKGVTFACINCSGEGKGTLSTFALKFRDASFVEGFRAAVAAHKDKTASKD